ncbi:MAG: ATP-binding cassette domain-containing protein [Salinisphaeraceae bacterium]
MAKSVGNELNATLGVEAIIDMADRRGLHASRHEVEQAWQDVTVERENERLSAAWQWLFQGHTAAPSPIHLLTNSQLPAWVVSEGCVGILTRLPDDDEEAPSIEWVTGSPAADMENVKRALVPVPPLARGDESFAPPKKRGPATQAIATAMWAHAPVFRRVAVATIFINMIAVLSAMFALQVYDRVVPNFSYATLGFLAAGVGIAYIIEMLFKFARLRLMEASTHRLDEALSLHFFDRLMGLKLDRRPSRVGSLVAQVRDYEAIKAFFTSSTLYAIADLPFVFIFITIIYLIGGPVAIVPATFVLLSLLIGLAVYRPVARLQREHNDAVVARQGLLFEAVAGADVVKAQGGEARFDDLWLRSTRETADRNEKLNMVTSTARFFTQFFQQLGFISILVVGVFVIDAGNLTMGGLIACSILGSRTLANISNITNLLLQWHHARYALQVLNELLDCPSDDRPDRQANTKASSLDLSMTKVAYGYGTTSMPQLVVPALEIKQGERIAILGKNGSGKSTLLKLLAGIATPIQGQVRIAGLDYEECRPSWLHEVIGYLPQDVRLFSGTLLDNLTLGMSMPSEERINEAMEQTGLVHAVRNHPEGLHLPITEGGAGLSGGQRQLVGLTRMVLHDPRIWLLDEPTASLDSDAEAKLLDTINKLPGDRTIIFTTHRQGWLDASQRVFIMDGGQIKVDEPREKVQMIAGRKQAQAQQAAAGGGGLNISTGGG